MKRLICLLTLLLLAASVFAISPSMWKNISGALTNMKGDTLKFVNTGTDTLLMYHDGTNWLIEGLNSNVLVDSAIYARDVDTSATQIRAGLNTRAKLSGATFTANVILDDGVGDSPYMSWMDADNYSLQIIKYDAGDARIVNNEGGIRLCPDADINDYLKLSTSTNIVTLETVASGDGDLVIKSGGGDISFDDDNLTTTGTVGIGTTSPNGTLEVEGPNAGNVGGFAAGALQVTGEGATQFIPAVITGHNCYNTNTQLWYLGSMSSSTDDIGFINRQNAGLSLSTNNTDRLTITNAGNVGIGDNTPAALLTVGNGDDFQVSATGNVSTTGTVTTDSLAIGTAYAFPKTDGTNAQVLKTDGSGALSWGIDATGGAGAALVVEEDGGLELAATDTMNFAAGFDLTNSGDGQVDVAADVATTSAQGIAEFSSDNFAVAAGVVTIKDGGVDLAAEVTGTLPEANGGTGDTDLDDIVGGTGITVTDGANAIIAGNATIAHDAHTGDVAGATALTIQPNAVESTMVADNHINDLAINFGTGTDQVSATDLPDFGTMTATANKILVADGSDFESVTMSGDATIASGGVLTITTDAVGNVEIISNSIGNAEMLDYAIGSAEMANEDHGDISWAFGVAYLDVNTVVNTNIVDGAITEADLKVVNSPDDEEIFTYEDATGDFEWHTPAELNLLTSATPITSDEMRTWVSNETGTGLLVFNTSPDIYTPYLTLGAGTSAEPSIGWDAGSNFLTVGDGSGKLAFYPSGLTIPGGQNPVEDVDIPDDITINYVFDTAEVVDTIQTVLTEGGYLTNSALSDSSITLLDATAWRMFYSNATTTAIQELAIGASGKVLKSNGASSAPTWETDAGAGLTYFTEADDNDTSVFTATGPNTTIGFDDQITLQGNDITGVGTITTKAWVWYTGGDAGGTYDSTDAPADGDQLTWNTGGAIDWQAAGAVAAQSIKGDHIDSTAENFVFDDAYRGTSAESDSAYTTQGELGDTATAIRGDFPAALTNQGVTGDHIDSTSENFVFDGAYHITSATEDSAYTTIETLEDTAALRLLLAGGTMSGDIDMGDMDITNAERVDCDTLLISGDYIEDFAGDGLSVTSNKLVADLGTAIATGEITDQTITMADTDTTASDFVFDDAYRGTSAESDSAYTTQGELGDSTAAVRGDFPAALSEQAVKGDHVDSVGENFVFDGAYHVTSATEDSAYITIETLEDTAALRLLKAGGAMTGAITTNSTFDGVDVGALDADVAADSGSWNAAADDFDTNYTQITLATVLGAVDVGGATSLEIPAVADPTTDAEGEIAWDANDDAIEVYSGDESESVLIPIYKHISIPIVLPDSVATYVPNLIIFKVNALLYPFGIEIDLVSIQLEADAAYSMVIEEWSTADPPVLENIISTVTTGASDTYAEEAPDNDGVIDAGDRIVLNIPSTDVDVVTVEIYFHIYGGN